MILRVALPVPLNRLFDYVSPSDAIFKPRRGGRVRVTFGKREMIGLIFEVTDRSDLDPSKLKPATELLDQEPLIDEELLDLGLWAANYYQHPVGDALINLLPILARKESRPELASTRYWVAEEGADPAQLPSRAVKQQRLLNYLISSGRPLTRTEIKDAGFDTIPLRILEEKKLARQLALTDTESQLPIASIITQHTFSLNPEQQAAVSLISCSDQNSAYLLAGVTGSGKTEVYFQAIEKPLREGKQALILVPEIGLTPQLVSRFQARFNCQIVCMHSGMSDRIRFQAWMAARSGSAQIIIGTRSSIFVPLANPGIILIDEEHDSSLKQQDGFRYNARDLALLRAHKLGIPIILGSATPSLESMRNAKLGRYQLLELKKRAGGALPPDFKLIDVRHETLDSGLSQKVIQAIQQHLAAGNQALVFINRRGFSPSLICQTCGSPVDCTRCDAHMTLHRSPPHLHCHHCDRQTPIPRSCHQCASTDFKPSGTGTERIEDRLMQIFDGVPIHRVDRDTTRSRVAFDRLISEVNKGDPCILVGTQMLAKGHHFPSVTLVCILNADAGLFSSDFRGMERMAQLTLQVAGRAGRAQHPGTVLLQTMNSEHPLLHTLLEQGYMEFAEEELTTRRLSLLPPFTYQALIHAEARKQGWAEAYLMRLRQQIDQLNLEELRISGPFPNPMEKKAGLFRSQLVLTAPKRPLVQYVLKELREWIDTDKEASRVRCILDVDPVDNY